MNIVLDGEGMGTKGIKRTYIQINTNSIPNTFEAPFASYVHTQAHTLDTGVPSSAASSSSSSSVA